MKQLIGRILNYNLDKNRHHFLITSHGQTASMWLAGVLNRIPDVFCSHGYSYPPRAATLEEISSENLQSRELSAKRFERLAVQNFFYELRRATDKSIVGNILAFYLGRLLSRMKKHKITKRNFTLINMVRHPVTRLTSTLKTWNPLDEDFAPTFADLDFATRCHHFRNYIRQTHKVDLSTNRNKSFIVALLAMEDIAKDVRSAKSYDIPNIKYEDITCDKTHFEKFIKHISDKRIHLSSELLDDLFTSKKINAHNKTGYKQAHEQFQSWEKWQQDTFKFTMERIDMIKVYNGLNYDFSFIK